MKENIVEDMEEMLNEAAKAGYINSLYELLKRDPNVLENIDKKPFTDTPLHIAASIGCTNFALEILRLKPSFGRKLNPDGFSPLELALLNGKEDTVGKLIKHDARLIRIQGREGITPLHRAAESNKANLLAEFLINCPASIHDTTIHGETAVHIAVKNQNIQAFKVLFGWLVRTDNEEVLNSKDNDGNTALHLATRHCQVEILNLIVGKVYLNDKNDEGLTALDIAEQVKDKGISKILKHARAAKGSSIKYSIKWEEFLISKSNILETILVKFDVYCEKGLSGDMRNALLVVAVLIATATYQALLQPPGGISQGGDSDSSIILKSYNNNFNLTGGGAKDTIITGKIVGDVNATDNSPGPGKVVMGTEYFYPFIVLNSIAFAASLGMIFALLPVSFYNLMLYVSLGFMFLSYLCSGLVITPSRGNIPYYALQAAFGVYILITGARVPFKMKSYSWVQRLSLKMWPKAFYRRHMEMMVILTKYSSEEDNTTCGCRLNRAQ